MPGNAFAGASFYPHAYDAVRGLCSALWNGDRGVLKTIVTEDQG